MTRTLNRAAIAAFGLAMLGACTATKLETRAAQLEHTARDARDVEQIIDEPGHLRDLALDH